MDQRSFRGEEDHLYRPTPFTLMDTELFLSWQEEKTIWSNGAWMVPKGGREGTNSMTVVDRSASSGGVKGQGEAARLGWGIKTQASCFSVAEGPRVRKKEQRGKGRGLGSCRGASVGSK